MANRSIEERFSAKNCIISQIEGVISDLEHMTSGNFMHNRASARLLAKCALKKVEEVITEERDRCIKVAQEWNCSACGFSKYCEIDNDDVGHCIYKKNDKCMERVNIRRTIEGGDV